MRRAILLGLLLAVAPGTIHAQRVKVAELEQILSGSVSAAEADGLIKADLLDQIKREDALAPRLAALELTERLTPQERARLVTKYKLGPLTRSALDLLADRSAFLDPPAGEIPGLTPPDAETQRAMVRQASEFVFKTLTHLPDFFALLTTTRFNDGPLMVGGEMLAIEPGMHRAGSSQSEITFSEGREVFDSSRGNLASGRRGEGLESQGEFGAEAATVMLDLEHGSLTFHHWENGENGPVAVYGYTVPKEHAHYEVKYSCRGNPIFHAQPAYHGTISIDPASGVLVRFTVEAESNPGDPITGVASVIEYGAVALGDRRYYCPLRSLALTVEEADTCHDPHKRVLARPVAMLNRIVFSDYHRLGSEMVIVPGEQKAVDPGDQPQPEAPKTPLPPHASVPGLEPGLAKIPPK